MKRLHTIGITLAAMLILSGWTSAVVFGLTFELAFWLVNGVNVTTATVVETTGELLFKNLLNGAEFKCSDVLHGTVEPESLDLITEILSLANVKVEELGGKGLACTTTKTCEAAPEFFPKGLPFSTELEQDEGRFYDLLFLSYEFKCKIFGITLEETCDLPAGEGLATEVVNVGNEVESVGTTTPRYNCTGGEAEGEIVNVTGNLEETSGKTLAVSLP